MTFERVLVLPLRSVERTRLQDTQGGDFTFADTGERLREFKSGPAICLLVEPPTTLVAAAVISRGLRLSTFEWRYRVEDALLLDLDAAQLSGLQGLDLGNGHLLGAASSTALLDEMRAQVDRFDEWYAFVRQRHASTLNFSRHGRDIVRQQADATRTALQIAGLDSAELRRAMSEDRDAPFLRDLSEGARVLEDAAIISDWSAFQDWNEVLSPLHAAVKTYRSSGGSEVTIIYANRTNIESSTGVDLVYYRHRPPGYLLVQYKMYDGTGDSARAPVDAQFRKELRAMAEVDAASRKHVNADCQEADGYRLSSTACFVKFCYRKPTFEGVDTRLLSGDVVPTEYLELALARTNAKSISPEAVAATRLTASQFTSLATSGLFGTCGDVTSALDAFLHASLRDGRRAVLALESPV